MIGNMLIKPLKMRLFLFDGYLISQVSRTWSSYPHEIICVNNKS